VNYGSPEADFVVGRFLEVGPVVKARTRTSIRVMDDVLKQQIGLAVRDARKRARLTQEALAERIGKSAEAISNVERGLALPTLSTLIAMARALDVPLSRLVAVPGEEVAKPAKRVALEFQLQLLISRLDDRALETALRQIEALSELRGGKTIGQS
jgi:transcriptional regulator with XRE-family HTH domain